MEEHTGKLFKYTNTTFPPPLQQQQGKRLSVQPARSGASPRVEGVLEGTKRRRSRRSLGSSTRHRKRTCYQVSAAKVAQHNLERGEDPVVSVDYLFPGKQWMRGLQQGCLSRWSARQLEALGHQRLILRSDDENVIKAVKRLSMARAEVVGVEIVFEESSAYDLRSNGSIEAFTKYGTIASNHPVTVIGWQPSGLFVLLSGWTHYCFHRGPEFLGVSDRSGEVFVSDGAGNVWHVVSWSSGNQRGIRRMKGTLRLGRCMLTRAKQQACWRQLCRYRCQCQTRGVSQVKE
eukprot:1218192-Amphidinium_carterae.2